jgi:hypothetical protein
MGSPGDFSNANTGPLPSRVVRILRIINAASNGDYDTVNRLARLALLSAAAGKRDPLVGNNWSM